MLPLRLPTGCLHIISFNGPEVLPDVRAALSEMRRLHLRRLVVDLRENCGGRLRDARAVARLLAAEGLEKVALLVSGRTASAAELLVSELRSQARQRCHHPQPTYFIYIYKIDILYKIYKIWAYMSLVFIVSKKTVTVKIPCRFRAIAPIGVHDGLLARAAMTRSEACEDVPKLIAGRLLQGWCMLNKSCEKPFGPRK